MNGRVTLPKRHIFIIPNTHVQQINLPSLQNKIQATEKTWPGKDANPKYQVTQDCPAFQPPCPTELNQRYLQHLQEEQVATQLLEQRPHD